jgi:hypothetical protein
VRYLKSLVAWWLIPGLAATIIVGLLTFWVWGVGVHPLIRAAAFIVGIIFLWQGWNLMAREMLKHGYKGINDLDVAWITAVGNTVMGLGLWIVVGIVVLAAIAIPSFVVVTMIAIAGLAVGIAALAICQI